MPIANDIPRDQRNTKAMAICVLTECLHFYLDNLPEKTEKDFQEEVLYPLAFDPKTDGDRMLQELMNYGKEGKLTTTYMLPMLVAAAYAAQSLQTEGKNQHQLANSLVMDAIYWTGVMRSSTVISAIKKDTAKFVKSEAARKNGGKRHTVDIAIKQVIHDYVRKKYADKKNNRSTVTSTISKNLSDIVGKSLLEQRHLGPEISYETIYNWLADMPDRDQFFAKKMRSMSKQKNSERE